MGLFKTYSEKQIKKITPLVDKIEALADKFHTMTNEELRAYTDKLKADLASGKTLDDILPEAYALVREADDRVLGKRPFRVQLIGAIILHQGRIAEMKTGEGKTLVATMPAYLNALTGKGVHIVTVNDYLARRDSEEMGRVYSFLGLTTGLITSDSSPLTKKSAYAADITYATNSEIGFDYLRDNGAIYKFQLVQRGHNFAIIDEVDSILIDEARTPLIISGQTDEESTELYQKANECVKRFKKRVVKELDDKEDTDSYEEDYIVNEKGRNAVLTKNGIEKTERFFGIDNLSDPENTEINFHITTAIRAHGVMKRDVDYIVHDNSVIIIDSFTGRPSPGKRYSDGLHQAIEAKENVIIQKENRTLATVTYQNYFRMYKKLSGMTGTALTEQDEFRDIYALDVVEVPTNMPVIRVDESDVVYKTINAKSKAILEKIKECHEKGQPVLVGTASIEKSEEFSHLLKKNGIPHNVLNAKHHDKEAEIIAQAGSYGAVTIATNMAGRGTDIMLGGNPDYMAKNALRKGGMEESLIYAATGSVETDDEAILAARKTYRELYEKYKAEIEPLANKVRAAGGLYILGTERHESRRIDNQLRGRSGRQGDPGQSRFYLSLEDDLLRLFGQDKTLAAVNMFGIGEDMILESRVFTKAVETAQKRLEANNFARRKHVLTYDDVMNQQRLVIYGQRAEILEEGDISAKIEAMIRDSVSAAFDQYLADEEPDIEGFFTYYQGTVFDKKRFKYTPEELSSINRKQWKAEIIENALAFYRAKDKLFEAAGEPGAMREIEKTVLLSAIDKHWIDHLDYIDDIKGYIGLNSYAQRDPVTMFRIQSAQVFDETINDIKETTVRKILRIIPKTAPKGRKQTIKIKSAGYGTESRPKPMPVVKPPKPGANDDCYCGSGKKYKKCCRAKDLQREMDGN